MSQNNKLLHFKGTAPWEVIGAEKSPRDFIFQQLSLQKKYKEKNFILFTLCWTIDKQYKNTFILLKIRHILQAEKGAGGVQGLGLD
jgi:hypothetical protein